VGHGIGTINPAGSLRFGLEVRRAPIVGATRGSGRATVELPAAAVGSGGRRDAGPG